MNNTWVLKKTFFFSTHLQFKCSHSIRLHLKTSWLDILVKGWKLSNWCLYFVYSCSLQDFNLIVWCTFPKLSLQYLIIIIQTISIEIWNPANLLKALWWGRKTRKKQEKKKQHNELMRLTYWLIGSQAQ